MSLSGGKYPRSRLRGKLPDIALSAYRKEGDPRDITNILREEGLAMTLRENQTKRRPSTYLQRENRLRELVYLVTRGEKRDLRPETSGAYPMLGAVARKL